MVNRAGNVDRSDCLDTFSNRSWCSLGDDSDALSGSSESLSVRLVEADAEVVVRSHASSPGCRRSSDTYGGIAGADVDRSGRRFPRRRPGYRYYRYSASRRPNRLIIDLARAAVDCRRRQGQRARSSLHSRYSAGLSREVMVCWSLTVNESAARATVEHERRSGHKPT